MSDLRIRCITVGDIGTNCYLVSDSSADSCFIVDPGAEADRILQAVGSQKVSAVLLTHAHFDHIGAVDEICLQTGAPLYMHPDDITKLTDPVLNAAEAFHQHVTVHTVPRTVYDGTGLELSGVQITVMHTPGHSMGSVCYLLNGDDAILTGDTLFAHGYGRTDFSDGNFEMLVQSLRKLFHLEPSRPAYPGHGEAGMAGKTHKAEDA